MIKTLALDLSKVTEKAAIATFSEIGKGNKNLADEKAVSAMKQVLNQLPISGEVIIGEGEIDEAPMLYIGEKVGHGGIKLDIAVDPIDGTRMVALGQDNAVAVMVFAQKDTLLQAPDMYMEKMMVDKKGQGAIDLNLSLTDNILNLAKKLNKTTSDLTIMTLAKPRHEEQIKQMQQLGVKVIAIPDGDVEGSVLVAMPESGIDMFYGIGGAPEGVISAAIIKSMGGDMQAKLLTRTMTKGASIANNKLSSQEEQRCLNMGISINQKILLNELCNTNDLVVSMTGITNGTLLKGVDVNESYAKTETLLIIGSSKDVKKIQTTTPIN
ncbi:MAG: class II fructose-bisphosphatase [Mycoplasmatales bacterium]